MFENFASSLLLIRVSSVKKTSFLFLLYILDTPKWCQLYQAKQEVWGKIAVNTTLYLTLC